MRTVGIDSSSDRDSVVESFMAAFNTLDMTATIERHLRRCGSPKCGSKFINTLGGGDDSSLDKNPKKGTKLSRKLLS